jgi:mono/diheme cytochrome c family protein
MLPCVELTSVVTMRRWPIAIGVALAAAAAGAIGLRSGVLPFAAREDVLDRYCVACHNDAELAGGVSFQRLDRETLAGHADVWEAAVRKLRTGLMPPLGEPRPARAVLDELASSLEAKLDAAWAEAPDPGARPLARLNRTEYANAIRDLFAFDANAIASTLPPDGAVAGFDNNALALGVSPTLLEGYASAAMQIGRRAVGDRTMGHGEIRYAATPGAQRAPIEGLPLGTRGGLAAVHTFPLDAEYEFIVSAAIPVAGWENPTGALVYCDGPSIDVTFNGAPVGVENPRRFRLRVPAGPQRITVALVDEQRCAGVNELYQGEVAVGGAVQALTIAGPFDATGAGDTPSRREIFVCRPRSAGDEAPCAEQILSRLATRAYRRPVASGSGELAELMRFYAVGRGEGGDFEVGIQYALSRLLVDPRFLYRFEREPDGLDDGAIFRVDGFELASRLSFFLWSSIPDDELLTLASEGRLAEPAVLASQADRMLADARSSALVDNFASQWLLLRELDAVVPQDSGFDDDLRAAMRRETEMLFADLIREPRSVLALLDADYTYLNERLAQHYGVDGIRGSQMRRVEWPAASPRRGVLGHGSILTATSAPNRTSPVVRGQWLMQSLLGAKVPSPPPGAEADLSAEASESEGLVGNTVRERLELHRANPTCAGCHGIMDPLGLSLENFDLLGRWRESEDGHAIDSSAQMVDGTELRGPQDLRAALLGRSDVFIATFTERLMTYALGRELTAHDMPVVRSVVRTAAAEDHTLRALVQAIVASEAFQKRVKSGDAGRDARGRAMQGAIADAGRDARGRAMQGAIAGTPVPN